MRQMLGEPRQNATGTACSRKKKKKNPAGPDAATWTVMVPAALLTEHAPDRPCDPIKHNMLAINMERWHLQPSVFSIHQFCFSP